MPKTHKKSAIILASGSKTRANMLRGAGLKFKAIPADIDEKKITSDLHKKNAAPKTIAAALAAGKALVIAEKHPHALVIGSDQILLHDGRLIDKAHNKSAAVKKLKMLRSQTHILLSAVAVVQGNTILWQYTDTAKLKMRNFTPTMLNAYVKNAGSALTRSVGAYEAEGMGAWLFESIKGDHFTIMGMPLLPLLAYLDETHGIRP